MQPSRAIKWGTNGKRYKALSSRGYATPMVVSDCRGFVVVLLNGRGPL
jgi:hypothetical protein